MIRKRLAAVSVAFAAAACGHPIFVPPAGPGQPADAKDVSVAWAAVTNGCRAATSHVSELRVSGRAGPQRIWRLSIESAVTRDQIYMNARISSQPIFVLAGSAKEATLWLRGSEPRVVRAPAGEIVEAILGLPVPPDRLLALLTGCITRSFDVASAMSYGNRLGVQTPDGRVYLERKDSSWQMLAGEVEGFTVELGWKAGAAPEKLWLNSQPGREPQARISVTVADARLNETVPSSFFDPPKGAANAEPMTVEELRSTGPWRKTG